MIRPFERIRPGEPISASEFNRAMREVERQNRRTVAPPLMTTSDGTSERVSLMSRPHIWVRITGHEAANASGVVADLTKYSGIEQTDDPSTDGEYDLNSGLEFYTDRTYLKEVNGRTDVPDNAIVRAYASDNGEYYTFLFEQAFEETYYGMANSGSGAADIRTLQYTDGSTSTNYIIDGSTGIFYFPSVIESFDQGAGVFDTSTFVFLVPKYQSAIVGGVALNVPLINNGNEYMGIQMPSPATLLLNDTAGELVGNPLNGTSVTWPVFLTTQYPSGVKLQCVGSPPVDQLVIGP